MSGRLERARAGQWRSLACRWTAIPLLALVALPAPVAAEETPAAALPYSIGDATAAPGAKAIGWLEVPKVSGQNDAGTRIPISVFQGARPGKAISIVAGVHGSEYAPIIALQRFAAHLDPAALTGTVVLVHIANPPSFLKRTVYYGPDDWKNLNRVFPGDPAGTLTERIAHTLVREVMAPADYFVDVHAGDANEELRPYVAYSADGPSPEQIAFSRGMAEAFGIDCLKATRGRSKDPAKAVFSTNVTNLMGKPTIAIESGGLGRTDEESVGRIERGLFNLLRHLGMLEGPPDPPPAIFTVEEDQTSRSPVDGIFQPAVEVDASVAEGQLLGTVRDFHGRLVHEARAPFAGRVLYILGTPPAGAGEPLVSIGKVMASSPPNRTTP